MSEYTREEILKMIEENSGPANLDLSGKDLSGIDLSKQAITKELENYRQNNPDQTPPWFSQERWAVHLHGAILKEANLSGAHLEGADLVSAHLEKVNLSVVASLAGAYFYQAWLDQTRMTREQLGERIGEDIHNGYYRAKEAYLLLKNNFNQIGRYDDASWAYVKERQMEKMTYHPKLARDYYANIEGLPNGTSPRSWTWWRFYVKYALKWFWDWIIEALCGYGELPFRTLGVALVVLLVFTGLFLITGGLTKGPNQTITLGDYFLFSLASFTTIDLPPLRATCPWAQFFATLEAISGISLLALLMFTLGNRISRS